MHQLSFVNFTIMGCMVIVSKGNQYNFFSTVILTSWVLYIYYVYSVAISILYDTQIVLALDYGSSSRYSQVLFGMSLEVLPSSLAFRYSNISSCSFLAKIWNQSIVTLYLFPLCMKWYFDMIIWAYSEMTFLPGSFNGWK